MGAEDGDRLCDICGKSIPTGMPFVAILQNIEHVEHDLLRNREEIEVIRSDEILTFCGSCGNRFDTDNSVKITRSLALLGNEGNN